MSCIYIGKAVTYKIANLHTAQLTHSWIAWPVLGRCGF